MAKPLSLGKVHLAHATRGTYCGARQTGSTRARSQRTMPQTLARTSQIENRVTCSQCLHAYDVEMSNQQHNADAYTIVSAL